MLNISPRTARPLLTFCVLELRNGYTVHGVSACASPENFNAELGRKLARENAVRQLWPLMGYALREDLFRAETHAIAISVPVDEPDDPGAVSFAHENGDGR